MNEVKIYVPDTGITILTAPDECTVREFESAKRALRVLDADHTKKWVSLGPGWGVTYVPDPSRYMNPPDYWGPE